MENIAIIGSRDFFDSDYFFDKVEDVLTDFTIDTPWKDHITIISGGALGADRLAEKFAETIGAKSIIHRADWNSNPKSAGYIRNQDIIDDAESLIAFWDGRSPGTRHAINLSLKKEIPTVIINYIKDTIQYNNI